MARFEIEDAGFEKLLKTLNQAAGDAAAERMLEAGAVPLQKSLQDTIEAEGHVQSGDLRDSIAPDPVIGRSVEVGPHGYDGKGTANALKLHVIEYGRSRQPAQPLMKKATRKAEDKVKQAMQEAFEEAIKA